MTPRTLVFVGPTASGKTALAIEVAEALIAGGQPAEIVNADSMLVYRGMDIGTAKPSAAEQARVRHHLIDIYDVTRTATVADFQTRARAAITDCHARGVLPILAGGSALYTRAIVDRFEFPGTDARVRAHWEAELERRGSIDLYAELQRRSPEAAAEMLPANGRRIVRALEVIDLTGRWVPTLPSWEYALPGVLQVGLTVDRELMDARIAERVEQMWAQGLVDEVRGLLDRGLREGVTASRAIGYRQVIDFLDGTCTEEEAKQATMAGTRRFARRQLGWYRRDDRIHWLTAGDPDNCAVVLRLLGE